MSKFVRLAVAAVAAVAGSLVVLPGVALADVSIDISVDFPDSPLTVGETGLAASVVLDNQNNGIDDDGQTLVICNDDDGLGASAPVEDCPSPNASDDPPLDNTGLRVLAGCGVVNGTECTTPDPGVFTPSATGIGRAGTECAGVSFDIVVDATTNVWVFDPISVTNVEITDSAGTDPECIVDFTVDVTNYPTIDIGTAPGAQTRILGSVFAVSEDIGLGTIENADDQVSTTRSVFRAIPELATQASGTIALGGTITDTAFVTGRANPDETGTVDFAVYGPDDDTCSGTPVFESIGNPISSGSNQVTSDAFAPQAVGTYRWIATYNGDRNNEPVAGACNDANESVVVTPGQPVLSTTASPTVRLGEGDLTDTATVSGRVGPLASTVSFSLFGPDDDTCAGPAIFTDTDVALPTTTNSVTSAGYTPTEPGTYRWIATYSGDANNLPAAGECNDAGESTVVEKAQPVLATDAGGDVSIGDELTDTATVTGRVSAGDATLDFRLYGPNDDDCSGDAIFEQLGVPFAATDDSITSDGFTPTATGTYRWVVTYSGDDNNDGAVGECGDPLETVEVALGSPTIVTEASASVPVGVGQLSDAAVVNGRVAPQVGATVSFRLYGPGDTTCSAAPVFEDLDVAYPVGGGTIRSGTYTPTVAGTYRWVASYSGDANNLPAVGECGDPAETVEVTAAPVTELPATGSETQILMRSGGALFLVGLAMVGIGNRKRYAR